MCVRDSISAFLADSAPKKLVFMVDGETHRIFFLFFRFPFPICSGLDMSSFVFASFLAACYSFMVTGLL